MKKAIFLLALAGILAACVLKAATPVDNAILARAMVKQTVTAQHKVYKKWHRVKRHAVKAKSARAQMQLRQAQKHQAEEQKVKKAQRELKKDTTKSN